MATRVRQQHRHRVRQDRSEAAKTPASHARRDDDLTHDLDGLLDEIDDALEENAEEFVNAFVQKGGE